jgi:hypothetical protein
MGFVIGTTPFKDEDIVNSELQTPIKQRKACGRSATIDQRPGSGSGHRMCNLYSITRTQEAMRACFGQGAT